MRSSNEQSNSHMTPAASVPILEKLLVKPYYAGSELKEMVKTLVLSRRTFIQSHINTVLPKEKSSQDLLQFCRVNKIIEGFHI